MKKRILPSLMKLTHLLVLLAGLVASTGAEPKRLLVVTTTVGFPHSSIPTAEQVLTKMGEKSGVYTVEIVRSGPRPKDKTAEAAWMDKMTKDLAEKMSPEALKKYDGIVFANTTGVLPLPDKGAFLAWIKSGKGFVGMHSASDTFRGKNEVDPYIEMLGGEFQTHGDQVGVECLVQDSKHPSTRQLGESYCIEREEIYLIKNYNPSKVHELLVLDKHPNKKKESGHFPVAWCKKYGQGNVFYTSLGHREDVWENETYQKHILGGIKWALGLEPGDATPQIISGSSALAPNSSVSAAETDREGFRPLFNGKDLTGWKLRNPNGQKSWSVKDGVLINTVNQGEHGTDLVTEEKFWNSTVRFEYKVPPGANSGFYLRGRHEIQILDDYKAGKPSMGGNGSIYQHTPVSKFASKPAGEWNTVEATMIGNKITVILNGEKVHDNVECNRPTGSEIDNKVNEPGPIFLQGDHGSVSFRNMRIKTLKT